MQAIIAFYLMDAIWSNSAHMAKWVAAPIGRGSCPWHASSVDARGGKTKRNALAAYKIQIQEEGIMNEGISRRNFLTGAAFAGVAAAGAGLVGCSPSQAAAKGLLAPRPLQRARLAMSGKLPRSLSPISQRRSIPTSWLSVQALPVAQWHALLPKTAAR